MAFYKNLATVFILSFANLSVAHPSSSAFPRGCEVVDFAFRQKYLIINEHGSQTFYLMQNHSNRSIEIEHIETRPDPYLSPKLQSQLLPKHWSAFASDVDNYFFQCFIHEAGARIQVDCGDYLDVCKYPRAKFVLSNQGTYWVSTNKELRHVLSDAARGKKILLHW